MVPGDDDHMVFSEEGSGIIAGSRAYFSPVGVGRAPPDFCRAQIGTGSVHDRIRIIIQGPLLSWIIL